MKHKWVTLMIMQLEIYHQNSQCFRPSGPFKKIHITMRHPVCIVQPVRLARLAKKEAILTKYINSLGLIQNFQVKRNKKIYLFLSFYNLSTEHFLNYLLENYAFLNFNLLSIGSLNFPKISASFLNPYRTVLYSQRLRVEM